MKSSFRKCHKRRNDFTNVRDKNKFHVNDWDQNILNNAYTWNIKDYWN